MSLMSCYGKTKQTIRGKISIKSFVESLKIVLEYLDQQTCYTDGIESIKVTFSELVAMEIKKAIGIDDGNDNQTEPAVVDELEREIQSKNQHIAQLEDLIYELQTALRKEVDKPVLQKLNDSSKSTIYSHDELTDVQFTDTFEPKKSPSRLALKQRLSNLFKVHSVGVETPSIVKSNSPEEKECASKEGISDTIEESKEAVETTQGNNKRMIKKLIHFNTISENKLTGVVQRGGLNDFDEFY